MFRIIRITGILAAAAVAMTFIAHQGRAAPPPESSEASPAEEILVPRDTGFVEVDWIEEMLEGGLTIICLALLSVALGAFLIERFVTLRRRNFLPPGLLTQVRPMFIEERYDEILFECAERRSVMSDIIAHCVGCRAAGFDIIAAGAADIGARAVIDQEEKCAPLTVIAGVAPLLGLLGTMIGMIEAFKLVEVFGDEGGASLLAGSISKALITTAVGLIIAIPAILGFHWACRRVHRISNEIETETEDLLKIWFLGDKQISGK